MFLQIWQVFKQITSLISLKTNRWILPIFISVCPEPKKHHEEPIIFADAEVWKLYQLTSSYVRKLVVSLKKIYFLIDKASKNCVSKLEACWYFLYLSVCDKIEMWKQWNSFLIVFVINVKLKSMKSKVSKLVVEVQKKINVLKRVRIWDINQVITYYFAFIWISNKKNSKILHTK